MKKEDIGLGYTIASGKLFCRFSNFHKYAEKLLGRPILTHEFANRRIWKVLRNAFEVEYSKPDKESKK